MLAGEKPCAARPQVPLRGFLSTLVRHNGILAPAGTISCISNDGCVSCAGSYQNDYGYLKASGMSCTHTCSAWWLREAWLQRDCTATRKCSLKSPYSRCQCLSSAMPKCRQCFFATNARAGPKFIRCQSFDAAQQQRVCFGKAVQVLRFVSLWLRVDRPCQQAPSCERRCCFVLQPLRISITVWRQSNKIAVPDP